MNHYCFAFPPILLQIPSPGNSAILFPKMKLKGHDIIYSFEGIKILFTQVSQSPHIGILHRKEPVRKEFIYLCDPLRRIAS